jgi:hypothetical protein
VDAAVLDPEIFRQGYDVLKKSTLKLTRFESTRLEGVITCDRNGLLYTSIPQNGNWKAMVDGREVETKLVGDCMMALELSEGKSSRVLCPTECDPALLRSKDLLLRSEEDIEEVIASSKLVIADPLFRPICPEGVRFAALPQEAFSGRIYRQEIPNLVSQFESFVNEVL